MRKMMDSGLDIVGQMPNEWNFVRLRYLCDITTGDSDTQDAEPDGEYPFYVRSPIVERSTKFTFNGEGILMARARAESFTMRLENMPFIKEFTAYIILK